MLTDCDDPTRWWRPVSKKSQFMRDLEKIHDMMVNMLTDRDDLTRW